ncbi:hypothetical protein HPC49_16050 [Pyxidicoccus fallax]|uniref:Cyclic beta 1-2 glucan synthetase n=1 Tax=Pyxidicoccus fallax TaxID=394095 RepID=A0A848LH98_9BACT|nr:hypothetical protein [Pyxidicoccus fallax]NMO15728.1 hypothetical protein [Pyxidicoccus fallax]NPC79732.1 hypothetical protein [Pyxidicoccus fallax]
MPVSPPVDEALDAILEGDPAGVYARMDGATRERYRAACAELAARSGRTPSQVAHEAVRWSAERDVAAPHERHVGMALLAEGRPGFEARLGCRIPVTTHLVRALRRHSAGAYVGSLVVLTASVLLGVERLLAARDVDLSHRLILVALLVLPALELLQDIVDSVLERMVEGAPGLPRLDPGRVFAPETRTLVVTPLLVASAEDIDAQLRRVEINAQGNDSPELFFALLTDFPDAAEQVLPGESELLEQLERGIRELNARHGHLQQPRFLWLHRERRWNPVARRWMGWERKRGKLEEFNRLVLGADDTSYTGPVPELVRTIRYVITLDADTHLIPGSAAQLVATLHHPLNQARFDASGRRVIAGYSMLQPSLENGPSRAVWLSTGGWPVSLVRQRGRIQPSLTQAAFGVGEFLGKGAYDVAAFSRALEGRIPENAILSHDKLEGMFARVAFVHDIRLFEGFTPDLAGAGRIWHRWIRGDWQLLPWLLPWVPTRDGRWERTSLSVLDRWRLLADLRRSLTFPAPLLVLTYGWLWSPGGSSALDWTLGTILWLCRRPLWQGVRHMLWRVSGSSSLKEALRIVVFGAIGTLRGSLMTLAILLPFTGIVMDAIIRALYRLGVDRTRILDWTTHAQTSRKVRTVSSLRLPEVWGTAVLTLVLAGSLAWKNPGALVWAAPMLIAWAPLVLFSRRERPSLPPAAPSVEGLRALGHRCWERYEQAPREAAVPPAPTDAALWLLAPLSAYHLGALSLGALVDRLESALTSVEALERHRGHLLVTTAGERGAAHTGRVSTAESGMWVSALIVIESALRAARGASRPGGAAVAKSQGGEALLNPRLEALEARARTLREEVDFRLLHDESTGLLRVGYDASDLSRDEACHERLASPSLLASFVAIARKQVPLQHWTELLSRDGKVRQAGAPPSTSAAAAEQLLPTLFIWFPPSTLLGEAALAAAGAALEPEAPPHLLALALRRVPGLTSEALQRKVEAVSMGTPREWGLALLAVTNLACDEVLIHHFHHHWQLAWVEALIYETKDMP